MDFIRRKFHCTNISYSNIGHYILAHDHDLNTIIYYRYDAIAEMINNPYFEDFSWLYRMKKKRPSGININMHCI